MKLSHTLLWKLASKRTESQQVPDPCLWWRSKHHVQHPEGLNHFHSHPAEDAEKCVVQKATEEATHTFGHSVSYGASEDEEHKEEEQSHYQTTVHQTWLVLRSPKKKTKQKIRMQISTQCLFCSYDTCKLLNNMLQWYSQNDLWPLSAQPYEENRTADDGHGTAHRCNEGQSLQVAHASLRVHILQRQTEI